MGGKVEPVAAIFKGWDIHTQDYFGQHQPRMEDFDVQWSVREKDIRWDELKPHQITNHVQNARVLTQKVEFARRVDSSLRWVNDSDASNFFPRCFVLDSIDSVSEFLSQYQYSSAVKILHWFALHRDHFRLCSPPHESTCEMTSRMIAIAIRAVNEYIEVLSYQAHQSCSSDQTSSTLAIDVTKTESKTNSKSSKVGSLNLSAISGLVGVSLEEWREVVQFSESLDLSSSETETSISTPGALMATRATLTGCDTASPTQDQKQDLDSTQTSSSHVVALPPPQPDLPSRELLAKVSLVNIHSLEPLALNHEQSQLTLQGADNVDGKTKMREEKGLPSVGSSAFRSSFASSPHPLTSSTAPDIHACPCHRSYERIRSLLRRLSRVDSQYEFGDTIDDNNTTPQSGIGSMHNLWICKPGALSRGRGIRVFDKLSDIVKHTGCSTKLTEDSRDDDGHDTGSGKDIDASTPFIHTDGKKFSGCFATKGVSITRKKKRLEASASATNAIVNQWVIQKYIERPLMLYRKKFDIRQWVMIHSPPPGLNSSASPTLDVWFYTNCYLRFSTSNYSVDTLDQWTHLCNQSVQKKAGNYQDGAHWQWSGDQFGMHLDQQYKGENMSVWRTIQQRMKTIATTTILCGTCPHGADDKNQILCRPNSFELFGYDFVIDDRLNPWLIEINSSPALFGIYVKDLVPGMLRDIAELTLQARHQWQQHQPAEKQTHGGKIITNCSDLPSSSSSELSHSFSLGDKVGRWEMIHRLPNVTMMKSRYGHAGITKNRTQRAKKRQQSRREMKLKFNAIVGVGIDGNIKQKSHASTCVE